MHGSVWMPLIVIGSRDRFVIVSHTLLRATSIIVPRLVSLSCDIVQPLYIDMLSFFSYARMPYSPPPRSRCEPGDGLYGGSRAPRAVSCCVG